jgi:class 3 adenylate cyclase
VLTCSRCGVAVGAFLPHPRLGGVCPVCMEPPSKAASGASTLEPPPLIDVAGRDCRVMVDAAWDEGMAGLAYVGDSIGMRGATGRFGDSGEAEMGALLLAMRDASEAREPLMQFVTDNAEAGLRSTPRAGGSASARVAEGENAHLSCN